MADSDCGRRGARVGIEGSDESATDAATTISRCGRQYAVDRHRAQPVQLAQRHLQVDALGAARTDSQIARQGGRGHSRTRAAAQEAGGAADEAGIADRAVHERLRAAALGTLPASIRQ